MRWGQDDWATDDGATLFCEYIAGWVGAQGRAVSSLCRHKEAMIVGDRRSPGGGVPYVVTCDGLALSVGRIRMSTVCQTSV